MILVFGGAYNGKLQFVLEEFNLKRDDVYFCKNASIDLDKKVICGLHVFVRNAIENGDNPLKLLESLDEKLKDKIIISDDLNMGIIPLQKIDRLAREKTGKCLTYISKNSTKVYRVFFGISTVIKDE